MLQSKFSNVLETAKKNQRRTAKQEKKTIAIIEQNPRAPLEKRYSCVRERTWSLCKGAHARAPCKEYTHKDTTHGAG